MKLSSEDIFKIPSLLKQGLSQAKIAQRLGVSKTTIFRVINKKSHKDLQETLQPMIADSTMFLENFKTCTKCNVLYPKTSEFFQRISDRKIGFEARCKTCKSQQNKDRLDKLKLKALAIYSTGDIPTCQCCAETTIEFLAIDHINGNGNIHRKQIKGKFSTIGQWLARNNYPTGFRTLCMNCNFSFGAFGYCPHEKN